VCQASQKSPSKAVDRWLSAEICGEFGCLYFKNNQPLIIADWRNAYSRRSGSGKQRRKIPFLQKNIFRLGP
jgi:hypothetical protein